MKDGKVGRKRFPGLGSENEIGKRWEGREKEVSFSEEMGGREKEVSQDWDQRMK